MRVRSNERLLWGGLLAATLAALAGLLTLGYLLARYQAAADYPGAALMAGQNIYNVWPNPTVRRDSSYHTNDPFPTVYNYYSVGFKLGPEDYAESNCIQMANNFTDLYIIERHMSVMVCDTPSGRLIFVMRSVTLRLPK
jgi:hypothetical protein